MVDYDLRCLHICRENVLHREDNFETRVQHKKYEKLKNAHTKEKLVVFPSTADENRIRNGNELREWGGKSVSAV